MIAIKKNVLTFILNDRVVQEELDLEKNRTRQDGLSPGTLVLDYLRKQQQLTGSKEGCKEGDCGACTVILGTLHRKEDGSSEVKYRPMTSCLLPLGELSGKHLVTIEGLNMPQLSPVQTAMVDCGGTQCGYCTPGFIVAMTNWLIDDSLPLDLSGLKFAISGNLCRCTGYQSIKAAGCQAATELKPKLQTSPSQQRVADLCRLGALPNYFLQIPQQLSALQESFSPNLDDCPATPSKENDPLLLAGGTDLYVQRGQSIPQQNIRLLNQRYPTPSVRIAQDKVQVDASIDFESFARHPIIQAQIPAIKKYNDLIASWPVRTRSTLGGNICNASPIADMTCLLLALEAELVLELAGSTRRLPLRQLYLGYKQLAKDKQEIVTRIDFPLTKTNEHIHWEKVSKRAWLDIATVNSAIKISVDNGIIHHASIALGGVAATPLYLEQSSQFLIGKALTSATVLAAVDLAQTEFNPISDVRGSANYKRLLARQLILAHFTELFPRTIQAEQIYASLR